MMLYLSTTAEANILSFLEEAGWAPFFCHHTSKNVLKKVVFVMNLATTMIAHIEQIQFSNMYEYLTY